MTLLEARPFLGGRAYSFRDPVTGDVVDNGPHAFVGAYVETLDFLAEIGASAKLAMQPRLSVAMADPRDGVGAVEAPALPGPLQAPAALLRYRLLAREANAYGSLPARSGSSPARAGTTGGSPSGRWRRSWRRSGSRRGCGRGSGIRS